MPFSVKDWRDYPDTTTPLTAAALEDLETRLSAYTDLVSATRVIRRAIKTDGNVTGTTNVPGDDVVGLSVTFTPAVGVPYYLAFSARQILGSTTGTGAQASIYEGSTQLAASKFNQAPSNNTGCGCYCETDVIIGDGAEHTYKVTLSRTAGSGNAVLENGVGFPAILRAIRD